jgi:hypothetical protein
MDRVSDMGVLQDQGSTQGVCGIGGLIDSNVGTVLYEVCWRLERGGARGYTGRAAGATGLHEDLDTSANSLEARVLADSQHHLLSIEDALLFCLTACVDNITLFFSGGRYNIPRT